jgi:transposase
MKKRPQPFAAPERARLLELIAEGAAIKPACQLLGIKRDAVYRWAEEGRREGAKAVYVQFSRAFDAARAQCAHKALGKLREHANAEIGGNGSVKATLAILQAFDSRFGDLDLRRRKLAAETELLEIRAKALEQVLSGEGGRGALIIGLEGLLESPLISEATKAELGTALANGKLRSLATRDLGAEPDAEAIH